MYAGRFRTIQLSQLAVPTRARGCDNTRARRAAARPTSPAEDRSATSYINVGWSCFGVAQACTATCESRHLRRKVSICRRPVLARLPQTSRTEQKRTPVSSYLLERTSWGTTPSRSRASARHSCGRSLDTALTARIELSDVCDSHMPMGRETTGLAASPSDEDRSSRRVRRMAASPR